MRVLICLVVIVLLSGCVSSGITKTVVVRIDAEGNVVETIVTESIHQVVALQMIEFEYLKLPERRRVRIVQ